MSRFHEPLTLPGHPHLLKEINDMSIAIKVHHFLIESKLGIEKIREGHPEPTWPEIEELLMKCYHVIDTIRSDPRKY